MPRGGIQTLAYMMIGRPGQSASPDQRPDSRQSGRSLFCGCQGLRAPNATALGVRGPKRRKICTKGRSWLQVNAQGGDPSCLAARFQQVIEQPWLCCSQATASGGWLPRTSPSAVVRLAVEIDTRCPGLKAIRGRKLGVRHPAAATDTLRAAAHWVFAQSVQNRSSDLCYRLPFTAHKGTHVIYGKNG